MTHPSWSPAAPARSAGSSSPRLREPAHAVRVLQPAAASPRTASSTSPATSRPAKASTPRVEGVDDRRALRGQHARATTRRPSTLVRAAARAGTSAPRLHLGRRRRPGPGRQRRRPRDVRLLRVQARRRAGRRRVRPAVDHAARHPVPRADADDRAGDGQAAGRPGPVRASASSRSRPTRSRPGSSSSRSASPRASCPTSPGRACTRWATCCAPTCAPAASTGRCPGPAPGKAARAFRAGANLAPDHAVGRRTWEEFLERRGRDSNPRSA